MRVLLVAFVATCVDLMPVSGDKTDMLDRDQRGHLERRARKLEGLLARSRATNAELRTRLAELEGLAWTDPLTGLANRRAFLEQCSRLVAEAVRRNEPLSVLMLDLDHFKPVNDVLGHSRGDLVLVRTAAVLREAIRAADLPARLGGDEFAVAMPATTASDAGVVGERILRLFEEDACVQHAVRSLCEETGRSDARCTISVGVSDSTMVRGGFGGLSDAADRMLYRAKGGGGGRVEVDAGRAMIAVRSTQLRRTTAA